KSHFDQGEEFTGTKKLSTFRKNYVRNKNAADEAMLKARSKRVLTKTGNYTGNVKVSMFDKMASSAAAKKQSRYSGNRLDFGKSHFDQGEEFTGTKKLSTFRKNYVRNKNAADEAMLKARPRKVVTRAGQYQGNVRTNKLDLKELFDQKRYHPDKKFVKPNKNNVEEERSLMTNIKLAWSRLFRKNETQPDHIKDKIGRAHV